jgi:hypothetical protein
MSVFPSTLEDSTATHISQLCADQVSEGTELELKSDLPTKDGRPDPWHSGGSIGDYARNEIAEEIIAFANTLGGVVCVGITETADHPKRADSPSPLPRVHDLARRLRQSVYSVIDPPLPVLEAVWSCKLAEALFCCVFHHRVGGHIAIKSARRCSSAEMMRQ